MNRRRYMASILSASAFLLPGCNGWQSDTREPLPDDDPFPVSDDPSIERGGADKTITATTDSDLNVSNGSSRCTRELVDSVRTYLYDELENTVDISVGRGSAPVDSEFQVLSVSVITERYDRDGELFHEADVEFESVVSVTPHTAYLEHTQGEVMCKAPIYVRDNYFQYQ